MSKKSKENMTKLVPALEPRVPNRAHTEMKNNNQANNVSNKSEYQRTATNKNYRG